MSDKPGWTTGPWHRNIKPASHYTTVWAGRNTHVARIVTTGLTSEELEANLDLIASAPMLYEALEAALNRMEGENARSEYGFDAEMDQARAALRLARGEGDAT